MSNTGESGRAAGAPQSVRRGQWTWTTYLVTAGFLTALLAITAPKVAAIYAGVVVVVFVVGMIRATRELRRFHPANAEGVAALARGDLNAAHAIWAQWAERAKGSNVSAVARHNLAWILMRQGELEKAVATLTENEQRNASGLRSTGLACTSALDLTLNHALLGNLEAAETWLAEADRRAHAPSLPTVPAMRAFAAAVLHCRAGRCDEAARMLDERWTEYEGAKPCARSESCARSPSPQQAHATRALRRRSWQRHAPPTLPSSRFLAQHGPRWRRSSLRTGCGDLQRAPREGPVRA